MSEFYLKVAGVTFEGRQRVVAELREGQALKFVPDPNNPYDSSAVRIVTADGTEVGFVSRDRNSQIFDNLMNHRGEYQVSVSSITGGGFGSNYGCNIRVVYTEKMSKQLNTKNVIATEEKQSHGPIINACDFDIEDGCLVEYAGENSDIEIPDGVTSIGESAFEDCEFIESVAIPNSVRNIGRRAFCACDSLMSIVIPDGVISIGESAFEDCDSLRCVKISDSVIRIERRMFAQCYNLESVVIPEGVTSIGDEAFRDCECIESVVIPNSVRSIGESAFRWCSNLKRIELPDSVTSIGEDAFFGGRQPVLCVQAGSYAEVYAKKNNIAFEIIGASCEEKNEEPQARTNLDGQRMNEVVCAGNLQKPTTNTGDFVIEDGLLVGYNGAGGNIEIPDGITSIGERAFGGCTSLESIVIPDSVTIVWDGAFSNCENLRSVLISKSVFSIEDDAFSGCKNLQNIVISEGVTRIGEKAFWGCTSLESIEIPDSVTSIGENAFWDCKRLKSVKLPSNIKNIEHGVFWDCKNLESIEIPEGVTSIGNNAFSGCKNLRRVLIPKSVTIMSADAFYGCNRLVVFTQGNSYARSCVKYTRIKVKPAKDFYVDEGTLCQARNVVCREAENGPRGNKNNFLIDNTCLIRYTGSGVDIEVPKGVTKIGKRAFRGCKNINSIKVSEGVTSIEPEAFRECNVESIVIPDGVTSIRSWAFWDCRKLKHIKLPNGITSIEHGSFCGCESLKSVEIPDSVTSIEGWAFWNCKSLQRILIPQSVNSIDKGAFENCKNLAIHTHMGSYAHAYMKNMDFERAGTWRETKVEAFYARKKEPQHTVEIEEMPQNTCRDEVMSSYDYIGGLRTYEEEVRFAMERMERGEYD